MNQTMDRLPPHSEEAELGVLGCIMASPSDCCPRCEELFSGFGKAVFYNPRNALVYETMIKMVDDGEPLDPVTLTITLRQRGQLDQVGGIEFTSKLLDSTPSSINLEYYAAVVMDAFRSRRIIAACSDAVQKLYDFSGSSEGLIEVVDHIESSVLAATKNRDTSTEKTMKHLVREALTMIEKDSECHGKPTGLPTGLTDLDALTGGLHPSEVTVIAARPSVGKTSLAMNIVEEIATNNSIPIGVFSMEMSGEILVKRMLYARSRVNGRAVRERGMTEDELRHISVASMSLARSPIHVCDESNITTLQLKAKARRMVQQHGIKALVIDYLQLMSSGTKRSEASRQLEVSEISRNVKVLARELNVPVLLLSQLNRDSEREKRRPMLSDLRESGAIEQDADNVWLLYRKQSNDDQDDTPNFSEPFTVGCHVAKQRNGAVDTVFFTFIPAITKFQNHSSG